MKFYVYNLIIYSCLLFFIGVFGLFVPRRNMIIVLMAIEIILLSGTINFAMFACYLSDFNGLIFTLMILAIAASESALGLALLVLHYRHKALISIDTLSFLKY